MFSGIDRNEADTPGRLILVGGPSGVGKTSVVDALVSTFPDQFSRPISYTTRPRRPGESDREYAFVTQDEILSLEQGGELANLDKVYEHHYAMSKQSIRAGVRAGYCLLKEVHPDNWGSLRAQWPDLVAVLLYPLEWLRGEPSAFYRASGGRALDDAQFFRTFDPRSADIIRPVEDTEDLDDVVRHLRLSLVAHISMQDSFPLPSEIDRINQLGYDRVAPEFTEEARVTTANFHQLTQGFLQSALDTHVLAGSKCLEIGPGAGWLRRSLRWADVDYVGVDISPMMAQMALEMTGDRVLPVHTVRSMPFPSDSFDTVVASLADPYCYPAALCEIQRVLRPNGHLLLTTPAARWAEALRPVAASSKTSFQLQTGETSEVYSFVFCEHGLANLLRSCGFSLLEIQVRSGCDLIYCQPISSAITKAAHSLGIPVDEMEIVNCVVASKGDS